MPFNLHWYFDAQCPCYSLAHRRFSHSLFKGWKKRDTSCLTEITSLPKPLQDINENAGATYCFFWRLFGNIYLHFYRNSVNAKHLFDNWCWQLSRCLEGELWEIWQGIKKAVQQPLLHCTMGMILRSQERPSPHSGHLYKQQFWCLEGKIYVWNKRDLFASYEMWMLCQHTGQTWSNKLVCLVCKMDLNHSHILSLLYQVQIMFTVVLMFII